MIQERLTKMKTIVDTLTVRNLCKVASLEVLDSPIGYCRDCGDDFDVKTAVSLVKNKSSFHFHIGCLMDTIDDILVFEGGHSENSKCENLNIYHDKLKIIEGEVYGF